MVRTRKYNVPNLLLAFPRELRIWIIPRPQRIISLLCYRLRLILHELPKIALLRLLTPEESVRGIPCLFDAALPPHRPSVPPSELQMSVSLWASASAMSAISSLHPPTYSTRQMSRTRLPQTSWLRQLNTRTAASPLDSLGLRATPSTGPEVPQDSSPVEVEELTAPKVEGLFIRKEVCHFYLPSSALSKCGRKFIGCRLPLRRRKGRLKEGI